MKELIINHFRTLLRRYKAQTFFLVLMVFLTSFLMSIFVNLWVTYSQGISEYSNSLNMETASFLPDVKVKQEDLADKYHMDIQKEEYKVIQDGSKIYKLFTNEDKKINKYTIIDGRNVRNEDEVLVDPDFLEANGVGIGEQLNFSNQTYTIVGTFILPNQVVPTIDVNKMYNSKNQALIILTTPAFHKIDASLQFYYSTNASEEQLEELINNEQLQYILKADDNPEISPLLSKFQLIKMIVGISGNLLVIIVCIVLIMALVQNINDDKKILGILKGEGYKDIQLILSYFQYAFIATWTALLGSMVGVLFVPMVIKLLNTNITMHLEINILQEVLINFIICSILGTIMWIVSVITANVLLSKPALALIRQPFMESGGKLRLYSSMNIEKILQLKLITRRTLIIILVVFAGYALSGQFIFGQAMYQLSDNISVESVRGINYNANVIFKDATEDYSQDGVRYVRNNVKFDNDQYSLIALDANKDYKEAIGFFSEGGDVDITQQLDEGVIINRLTAVQKNLKVGDTIQVSGSENRQMTLKVSGISQFLQGKEFYTSTKYLLQYDSLEKSFNGIYVKNPDKFAGNDAVMRVITVSDIKNNLIETTTKFKTVGLIQYVIGIILGCAILIMALNIAIFHNRKEISLLLAMGYPLKSVKRITVYSYGYLVAVGLIIGGAIIAPEIKFLFTLFSKASTIFYPVTIPPAIYIEAILASILIFYICAFFFVRRLRKQSFVELFMD
ncbi:FtsX-like permease family protein [Paenibacillus albiflavus]|uniref:FtsX-like permease family protein n=1 Tax=Paenibacillus albiflavus TaxID=2545760 RepID=A0A4R4ECN1_9BACL|nr:ABC transporter permease [Paenibacillus albiflavus]TCZ77157.1 FtsX-like permease family protein [Paenibacillus albiflavus]